MDPFFFIALRAAHNSPLAPVALLTALGSAQFTHAASPWNCVSGFRVGLQSLLYVPQLLVGHRKVGKTFVEPPGVDEVDEIVAHQKKLYHVVVYNKLCLPLDETCSDMNRSDPGWPARVRGMLEERGGQGAFPFAIVYYRKNYILLLPAP